MDTNTMKRGANAGAVVGPLASQDRTLPAAQAHRGVTEARDCPLSISSGTGMQEYRGGAEHGLDQVQKQPQLGTIEQVWYAFSDAFSRQRDTNSMSSSSASARSVGPDETREFSYGVSSETPNTVHITIGSDAKTPNVTRLKELSIRLAYTSTTLLQTFVTDDLRRAVKQAVQALRESGIEVASDLSSDIEEASR